MSTAITQHREELQRHAEKDLPTSELAQKLLEIGQEDN